MPRRPGFSPQPEFYHPHSSCRLDEPAATGLGPPCAPLRFPAPKLFWPPRGHSSSLGEKHRDIAIPSKEWCKESALKAESSSSRLDCFRDHALLPHRNSNHNYFSSMGMVPFHGSLGGLFS